MVHNRAGSAGGVVMQNEHLKLWLQGSLNQVAIKQAQQAINRLGRALPCRVTAVNGSIVTVAFEVNAAPWTLPPVTIPKAEGPWIRSPTQVGDFGMTVPADVYLGGISGLGGGVANMTQRAPLTALVWVPVASTNFGAVNTNAAYISGPDGVVAQDTGGTNILTLDNAGTLTITSQTKIVLNAPQIELNGLLSQGSYSGSAGTVTLIGPVTVINDVTAGSISLESHVHGSVQAGDSDTGPPVSGT